ncbi:prostaglandin reductase 1 [Elysia marginata]|uniref:15-oxoprostaglandin 13-reductase n=1 Tax=Elysia marginata TaxID=1093978 RepID=A0AAV4H722_9GAST|nr:prostaglandin reductase 1 [Elysia marginata]
MEALPCINKEETTASAKECEPDTDATKSQPGWLVTDVHFGSQWVKIRDYIGVPSPRDFRMTSFSIPKLAQREILVESLCWSVENYMREFDIKPGSTMMGEVVASVVASRHKDYKPTMLVTCAAGWRTHCVFNPDVTPVRPVVDILDFPASVCLGPLGLPGLVAYFSFLGMCNPQPGDIVLVNAAAGSVGSVIGQLAKIQGCKVIAFAASKDRCDWIRELGFDWVYCQNVTVSAALTRQAHDGVDFFFDCVGAEFTKGALQHMKLDGTVCVFGHNKSYASRVGMDSAGRFDPYTILRMRHGKVKSRSVFDFQDKFVEAQTEMLDWMLQGKLRFRETMFEGFDRLPEALNALYDKSSVGTVFAKSNTVDSLSTSVVSLV